MEKRNSTSDYREIKLHRRLLAVLGGVYFLWWFLVEALLPGNYNPFLSRLLVVSIPSLFLLLSFFNIWIKTRLRILLDISLYLVTFHYFYLFYVNVGNGEINWIIGAFITITAISYCFFSSRAVLIYSLYVLLLSVATAVALPDLRHSVFFPGLATILFQANIGWRSRLNLINTLSESNKKFQTLFDSTFEGILVHENGVIISANEALAKMTGYSKEELLGRNTVSLTTPEQIANAKERLKKKTDQPYDSQVVRKDGSVLDVEARSREFNYNSQPAYLVTVKDITDRKQAEQERVAALAMAENLRLRDDFISSASHEFKTPIAILRLQAQIIERDLKTPGKTYSPEELAAVTDLFNRQVKRLNEIVESMLDVSIIAAQRLTIKKEKIDLQPLVLDVISVLQVSHLVTLSSPTQLLVWADPSRLRQVVENLLDNAVKYGNRKPVRITLKEDERSVFIIVEDQGIGIAPHFIDRVFERFERGVSSEHISGFGLGLYLSREIIEGHGGTIQVESEFGQGSKFTVTLPKS